jgi:chromosome segregation ATPase
MRTRIRYGAVAALGLIFVASPARAQQSAPPADPMAELQEWVAEMQRIQAQLAPIHARALEDAALKREQEAAAETMRAAMIAADPTLAQAIDRMEALLVEARAAQQAGDAERIARLNDEAETLQPRIVRAQAQALAQPHVLETMQAYQTKLHARMIEIDERAGPLIARFQELDRRLTEVLRGGD